MSNGHFYFHTNKGEVAALEVKSGNERWRKNLIGSDCKSSLHVRGDKVAILTEGNELTMLCASSGTVAWRRKIEGVFNGGLAMNDQALYIMGGTQSIDMSTGRTLWDKSDQVHGICSAPTLFNDLVLAAAGPHAGDLNIFDATGRLVSKVKNAAFQACDGAIVLKGKIFTIGGGHLLAFECKSKG
jgi:outer membrane protein assembly factor BamB